MVWGKPHPKWSYEKPHCPRCDAAPFDHQDNRVYRLANGKEPLQIVGECPECGDWRVRYRKSGSVMWRNRRQTTFVPLQEVSMKQAERMVFGKQERNDPMKTLYQFKNETDGIQYGYKLAVNSAGMWVMEVKQTGAIVTVDREAVEEVMAYTVDVSYLGRGNATYSFFARTGDFNVGDVVFSDDYETAMKVKAVDTKSRNATKWLTGTVLSAAKVVDYKGE